VHLTKGERFSSDFPPNLCGIDLDFRDRRPVIRDVEIGGTAWKCGIRPGDILVEIDGRDPRAMTQVQVATCLSLPERKISLKIARLGGKHIQAVVLSHPGHTAIHSSKPTEVFEQNR
jgi:C-terminal processing protease CtpA/Prc